MIVIDASAVLELILRSSKAKMVEQKVFDLKRTMHAPHLIDVEVTQVIRRYTAAGELDVGRGRAAIADLLDFPINRYPHDFLLPRMWELRNNLTAYDAAYVALAEALGAPLLTCDQRLTAAPGIQAEIELV